MKTQLRGLLLPFISALLLVACGDDAETPALDASVGGDASGPGDAASPVDGGWPDAELPPDANGAPDTGPVEPELRFVNLSPPYRTEARDISHDGRTILFEALGGGALYLYDVATATATRVTELTNTARNQALAVSNAGHIAASYGYPVLAGRWSAAEGWRDLGSPFATGCFDEGEGEFSDIAGAFGMSANGLVVAGLAYDGCTPKAFRWTETPSGGQMLALELLGVTSEFSNRTEPNNRASVVSADGRVVAGWAENGVVDRSPAIWREDGTGFMLDPNDFDAPGEVLSISADGSVVAGTWGGEGFVWSEAEGRTWLGRLPDTLPFDQVFANAMAQGGELIFGTHGGQAIVWTKAAGLRTLGSVVRQAGIELDEAIVLENVLAASDDGTVIIGSVVDYLADPFGLTQAFVLRLPVSAYGL